MSVASVFDWTCEALEVGSSLTRIEARGTIRIALKTAGLTADGVDAEQMFVVVNKILPAELGQRAVSDAEDLCHEIARRLQEQSFEARRGDTAETVFSRLGGRA